MKRNGTLHCRMVSFERCVAWITLWGLPILMISCTALHQKHQIPKCRTFFMLVDEYWHRDAASGLHPMKLGNQSGIDRSILDCQECLSGLPKRDFERMFGKPDTAWGNHLAYFLTEPCKSTNGANANLCFYMECVLDAGDKVKGVTIVMDQNHLD
jgi:hypothetical protein